MWREIVACLLCVFLLCGALWLMGSDCDRASMSAQQAVRMEFLTTRVEYLTRAVELERQRADVAEQTAKACGNLLDALKSAMGVGP